VQEARGATPLGGNPCAVACEPRDADVAMMVDARKSRFMSCPPSLIIAVNECARARHKPARLGAVICDSVVRREALAPWPAPARRWPRAKSSAAMHDGMRIGIRS
jgi:hypothetical protein